MAQQTMYPAIVNSPQTEINGAIDSIVTTITVLDGTALPAAPNLVVIGTDESAETVLYSGKSINDLTGCTRGFQGTAKAWGSGAKVARYLTAYDIDTQKGNIEDLDTSLAAHEADTTNPHEATKLQIGLGNVIDVEQMPIAGGTATGIMTAQNNTSYTTKQVRNITLSTTDPSGGSNGDVWIKYTP